MPIDPFIGGALLTGAGSLLTNASNRRQAERQMAFQREMSSTSHQREVKDLEAAGLNPLLSATQGASTPGGAMAQMQNPVETAIASASEAKQIALAIAKQKEEIELIKSQKSKNDMETRVLQRNLPETEMKNYFYNKVKEAFQSSASPSKTLNEANKINKMQQLKLR